MHLIVPFAAPSSEPVRAVLAGLALPNLRRVLGALGQPARDMGDEWSLSTPHERAWARAMGWGDVADGLVPKAAWMAQQHGLHDLRNDAGTEAGWALLTPTHWRLGTEQVSLTDPDDLHLDETQSRAFFEAVRGLFESEGFALHWLGHTTWLCQNAQLADLPTASLDRVIGRNVDRWLGADARARLLRRLQNEVQMLLHEHPLNQAREARGEWPLNSVWLSGCGRLPAAASALMPEAEPAAARVPIEIHDSLRGPALADNAEAWRLAFEAFDASALAEWPEQVARNGQGSLTLCGERGSLRWAWRADSAGARLLRWVGWPRPAQPAAVLQDL